MGQYKVYFLDLTGHIAKAQDIECQDDMEAFGKAQSLSDGYPVELWQGARQVAHISAEPSENVLPFQRTKRTGT